MTFEEALVHPGSKVQAWDLNLENGLRTVLVFEVGPHGARQLAFRDVPDAERPKLTAELRLRGLAPAETDFSCDFVWVPLADGLIVYDGKRQVLEARGDRVTLACGRVLACSELQNVIAFAADDYVERGVKAELLRSGETVDLVTEHALSAMGDPTYSRNQLLFETEWCGCIAHALAAWAGTRYEDRI